MKSKVKDFMLVDESVFDLFELLLIDHLIEDAQFRCSKVLSLISYSTDSFRYFNVKKKFDDLQKISRKLEPIIHEKL